MIERTIFIIDREGKNELVEVYLKGNDGEAISRIVKLIFGEFDHHTVIEP